MPMRREKIGHLLDAGLVGAHAAADGERRCVDPDAVAALDLCPAPRCGRGSGCRAADRRPRAAPAPGARSALPMDRMIGAVVGHQRRIMREDRIGQPVVGVRQPFDLGARSGDEVGEARVLRGGARRHRSPAHSAIRADRRGAWRSRPSASARASAALPSTARRTTLPAWMFISSSRRRLRDATNHCRLGARKGRQTAG